jgi:hypothetical protein
MRTEPKRFARLSRGERDGETADAQAGNHRISRESQLVRAFDEEADRDHDSDEAHSQPDELAIQAALRQALRRHDRFAEDVAPDQGQPSGAEK